MRATRIERKNSYCTFGNIEPGEVFEYSGVLHMKTYRDDPPIKGLLESVQIETGRMTRFSDATEVIRLEQTQDARFDRLENIA